jgi:methylthioribulose-1-phosphate dehydratase
MKGFNEAAEALVSAGRTIAQQGWVPATSGNFSVRLPGDEIAITVSGAHKGYLTAEDVMRVDLDGRPLEDKRPSAETLLHVQLYRHDPAIGAVLHTHSINATVVSRLAGSALLMEDLEILKAFAGVDTHETRLQVPVFDNDQDMQRLARHVEAWLGERAPAPGYLIAGHGLYTWGATLSEALRHLEAFEYLFQYELETRRIRQ